METTLTFTDEEICCLESMFEVLVEGDGEYVMLGLPEILKTHSELLVKFKKALKEATGIDRG